MSIVGYLEEIVDSKIKTTQNGKEVHFACPICNDHKPRMYVNTESHMVHCFNCDYSSSFIQFIMDIEKISYSRAVERYKDIKETAYIPDDILKELHKNIFIGDIEHSITKRPIPLPEEFIQLNFKTTNPTMKRAIRYLVKERGITIRQMKQHGFGICLSGEYKNRVIIPIKEFDETKFFVGRAISKNEKLKEKSPTNESYQISKSQVLFNIDRASAIFGKCVISEGIFDALSFGDIGVSALGKRMSDEQIAILLDYKDYLKDGVYLALDWDARKNATDLAKELYKYMPVHMINMPKGDMENGLDPNEYFLRYGRKAMYKLIDNAEEYGFSNFLKRKFFI